MLTEMFISVFPFGKLETNFHYHKLEFITGSKFSLLYVD